MRMPRDEGFQRRFALAYLKHADTELAAKEVGVIRSPRYFGNRLLKRPGVQRYLIEESEARKVRLKIDADFVLSELMRQYVRLTGMLGHDMASLYSSSGALLPLADWPEVWRTRLVTEVTAEELSERSHDNATENKQGGWDRVGTVTKIKRETTLAIEKEIRACLAEIGRHVNVKAFPVPGDRIGEGLSDVAAAITGKLQAALRREQAMLVSPSEDEK